MAKEIAIVLNNGSINSAVATALAAQKFRPVMLHALLGSEEEAPSRARVAFDQQVLHFKPYREHLLPMPFMSLLEPTGPNQQLALTQDTREQTPLTPTLHQLLPLMAAAGRFAVHYQAAAIYLGLRVGGHVDELAQATEYVQVWAELMQLPCGMPDLDIAAPLLEFEPWQVLDLGFEVSAPLERTWSCLGNAGEPCGACRGCRSRDAAFQQAGRPDPSREVTRGSAKSDSRNSK
jgi:7-cyano-7-deazaguanine synthase